MENVAKRRKDDFVDDGRVIADMSIDGMPGTFPRRRRKPPAPYGVVEEKPEPVKLTLKERIAAYGGVFAAYAVFGIAMFGGLGLVIWLWLK